MQTLRAGIHSVKWRYGLHMFFVSLSLPAIALESATPAGTSAHGCSDEAITRMDATNRRSRKAYYAYTHFLSAIGARLPRTKKYMQGIEPMYAVYVNSTANYQERP